MFIKTKNEIRIREELALKFLFDHFKIGLKGECHKHILDSFNTTNRGNGSIAEQIGMDTKESTDFRYVPCSAFEQLRIDCINTNILIFHITGQTSHTIRSVCIGLSP